ncbi:MAG: hypothetical protein WCT04_18265 [Planctomycetota bacterium]
MRIATLSVLAILLTLSLCRFTHAGEAVAVAAKPADAVVKWQDSEAGQFVFFAVLEGLYRDGVSNEIVDLIIDPPRDMDNKIKHTFVIQCEICHAAYEAFVLYRRRQTFQLSAGRDTLGKGADVKIVENLKGDAPKRVFALGALIRPWIMARVELTKLSREKQEELMKTLVAFKKDAGMKLGKLRRDDPLYNDWNFYGSCQACEAATEISRNIQKNQPK